jgi:hypothetical protein
VIQYATFIQAAGELAGAADTEEARRAVEAVIAAVAASLEESDRDRLVAVLPGSLRGAADIRGQALHPDSGAALVSAVSAGSGCPAERARFYTQAVLSTLASSEPEVARVLARRLPDGEELFAPIDHEVPPRGAGVPIGLTPRLLDRDEVDRALVALEGWERRAPAAAHGRTPARAASATARRRRPRRARHDPPRARRATAGRNHLRGLDAFARPRDRHGRRAGPADRRGGRRVGSSG